MMSPWGRSFSAWIRLNSTPEPVLTDSTWIPVALVKAANTRSLSVLSLAE
jgi:hypothetical protein